MERKYLDGEKRSIGIVAMLENSAGDGVRGRDIDNLWEDTSGGLATSVDAVIRIR